MAELINTQKLVNLLIEKNYRISCAESCTGGMLAASIVEIPDASKVFEASFVTYASWTKTSFVDVDSEVIEKYGVVSNEVARLMATGAAQKTNAQIGVGITGFAGPAGGDEENPVGTVCFGFYINGSIFSQKKNFGAIGRNAVRALAVDFAVNKVIDLLENK